MATDVGSETVEEAEAIIGDKGCSTIDTVERKKKSVLWTFFSVYKEDKSKAICLTCSEKVSRGGNNPKHFNTTNLRKHLQGHSGEYKKFFETEATKREEIEANSQASAQAKLKQITLQDLAERKKPFPPDHPRAKEITHRLAEMIAIDLQPFSIVEDIGFCRLMANLEPRYSLPSRRYLSEVVIPEIHSNVKHRITELIQSAKYISLTTDIWTSTNCHHSFLSLTAHFIVCPSMEKKDVMLTSWLFDESHTGANISSAILSRMQSWEIEEKVVCVVRDNAANMVAGLNIANVASLPCLAHSLQLIIKDGVLLQPAVVQLLNCARSIVGHYHRSNVAFNTFRQIQSQLNLPAHRLIQDVPTRWNSSYYMLERLVEQKKAITASNAECQPPTELRSHQWVLAEKVVKLLKVFEEATREISGEYSSASVIIPIINSLKRTISQDDDDHGIMSMKRGMLKSISDRCNNIELQPLCVLATVLDPRFKLKGFSNASNAANARMILIKECEEYLLKLSSASPDDQPQPKRSKQDKPSTLWSLFDEMMAESEGNSERHDYGNSTEIMVEMYLKEPLLSHLEHIHPMTYWKEKQPLWPCLADLACKYLSIPPSSAASERLFSSAGDIVSPERNRILPEKAEMLLFLKKNLPVVGL